MFPRRRLTFFLALLSTLAESLRNLCHSNTLFWKTAVLDQFSQDSLTLLSFLRVVATPIVTLGDHLSPLRPMPIEVDPGFRIGR